MREAGVSLSLARGKRDRAAALGVLQPLLPPHLRRAPLEPVPQPGLLPAHRRGAAASNLALVLAERDGRPIACVVASSKDEDTLYGRYWGALEHVPLLHFECCYYQAIEYAIARGLQVFEGGAQGEHKIFRGLLPVEAPSAHWLAHPRFARAVEDFLEREGAGHHALRRRAVRT